MIPIEVFLKDDEQLKPKTYVLKIAKSYHSYKNQIHFFQQGQLAFTYVVC